MHYSGFKQGGIIADGFSVFNELTVSFKGAFPHATMFAIEQQDTRPSALLELLKCRPSAQEIHRHRSGVILSDKLERFRVVGLKGTLNN